jgi:hypothetical protein
MSAELAKTTNNKRKAAAAAAAGAKANASQKKSKKKSPHDVWFETFNQFMKTDDSFLGYVMVEGIQSSSDDEDNEDDEDTSKYTKQQMDGLRFIIITKSRSDKLDEMKELVLGDQAKGSFMMFDTSFSYQVSDSWEVLKRKIAQIKNNPATKLDLLLAYTHILQEYDVWMHDNEGGMDTLVKGLAGAWKRLLAKSNDAELGWDTEYTKPAVLELLGQFQRQIESMDSCYGMGKFKYK